jgi:hypothetical protein
LWIRTKDPDFSGLNPKKGVKGSKAELLRAASECTYVFSNVRGHPIPSFLAQEYEFNDLEKPDGLRFVRMAEFDSSGG